MRAVSRPVLVFCRDGCMRRRASGRRATSRRARRPGGTGSAMPPVVNSFSHASHAILPSATTTCRRGGVRLICQVRQAPIDFLGERLVRRRRASDGRRDIAVCQRHPSSMRWDVEMLAKPARLRAAIRKSPDAPTPSPVNTLPVRFAPWAPAPARGSAFVPLDRRTRERARPIHLALEGGLLHSPHFRAVAAQARARFAANDGLPNGRQRG